jgi:hypothetical protein
MVAGSFQGARVVITPPPRKIARDLKKLGDGSDKELKRLHKKLANIPLEEVERRANALGSGFVRVGRGTRTAAQAKGVVLNAGGARFPDFAGWEFGASGGYRRTSAPVFGRRPSTSYLKRTTRQFRAWRGNGEDAGYVIHPILRDEPFMNEFGEKYVEELDRFLGQVYDNR